MTSEPAKAALAQWIEHTRSLRSLMRSDPHRPIYHFVAPEGAAMPFDPNGALYWRGKYHLGFIYQKRPASERRTWVDGDLDNAHVWGHVVSTDLLHWTHYADMLDIEEGGEEIGIFSGDAFLSREGVPHIAYYSVGAGCNRLARAMDDDLKAWSKFPKPALTLPDPSDPDAGKYTVFDPTVWYDRNVDAYYQISGGKQPGLFKSKDLHEWQYLGDVIDSNNILRHAQEDLSCPDFFSLGSKYMLLFISHQLGAQYYLGTFADDKFSVERHGRMNWPGGTFFAPEQLEDANGRNIVWGWIVERKPAHLPDYAWSGIMSLPRVLSLGDDGSLRIRPAQELRALRVRETWEQDIELAPNSECKLQVQGTSIELKLKISGARTSPVGVKVFVSADGREQTVISYDPINKELTVDFSRSSVTGPVSYPSNVFSTVIPGHPERVSAQRAPLELAHGEPLELDIFLDKSVIEIFANDIQCVTQVVYPELDSSSGVRIFSGDETIRASDIHSWTLAHTNPY